MRKATTADFDQAVLHAIRGGSVTFQPIKDGVRAYMHEAGIFFQGGALRAKVDRSLQRLRRKSAIVFEGDCWRLL